MIDDFSVDYILARFQAVEKTLDALREVATKIFNAIMRIELQIEETTDDLRDLEES